MEILSPKEYFKLLYQIFFRIVSLGKEIKKWDAKKRLGITLQSGVYNFILGLTITVLIYAVSFTGFYSFNLIVAVLNLATAVTIGVVVGVIFGAVGGTIGGTVGGVVYGVVGGAVGGVVYGVVAEVTEEMAAVFSGVAEGLVYGMVNGMFNGVCLGVAVAVAVGVTGGVKLGVTGGVALGVTDGVAFAVVYRVVPEMIVGVTYGVTKGITGGVVFLFSYLIVTQRLWYLPYLYLYAPPPIESHPMVKDENFGLPFPFLTGILRSYVEKRDMRYAEEIINFIIENRPALRKQAQDALTLITFDKMQKITTAEQLTQFEHLSDSDEENSAGSINNLGAVAHNIKKGYESHNLSNRLNIYKETKEKIIRLREANRRKGSKFTTDFSRTAEIWEAVVETEIEEIEQSCGLPLPNPFIVGKPVKGKTFIGRDDIIEDIKYESLRNEHTGGILFVGNRRTGKTSTLINLNDHIPDSLKAVHFDFQDPQIFSSTDSFCRKIAGEIGKYLKIAPETKITGLSSLGVYFETVQKIISERMIRLLVCFDEFEKMTEKILQGNLNGLADSMRYWIQHLDNFIFLFAGGNEIYEFNDFDWSDYLINLRTIRISYFNDPQSRQLMTKPVPEFDLKYRSEKLLEDFIQRMGGHPFLIQAVMYNLTEILNNDHNRKTAEQEDIDEAVEKCFISCEAYFHHFWEEELNESMRTEIKNLAENRELTNRETIRSLLRKEFIKKENDTYKFSVPLIKEWVILRHIEMSI